MTHSLTTIGGHLECAMQVEMVVEMVSPNSAVNLKGIWPRREPKAWAVQRSCGGGSGALFVNLASAAASAASMQFTALPN